MSKKEVAVRKRQKIAKANKNMFIVIAVTAFVVGFAIVASVFLFKKLLFNQKVISQKSITIDNLKFNNNNIDKLSEDIRVLKTNENLLDNRLSDSQDPLMVILDALPNKGNSSALGSSLKERLLKISGVEVESLVVNSTAEEISFDDESNSSVASADASIITFKFKVSGNMSNLNKVLKKLEKSIRPIYISSVNIESGENKNWLTVEAYSYYEPAITAQLKTKTIKAE